MTKNRINHSDHGWHANTPAGRAACRRLGGMDPVTARVAQREAELGDAFEGQAFDLNNSDVIGYDEDGSFIDMPWGRIRVGSLVTYERRGGTPGKAIIVGFGTKNDRPLVDVNAHDGEGWGYLDQITEFPN